MRPIAVLGATGAIGGRFVEVLAGEGRAPVRALVHRWWHTARLVRFPIELREIPEAMDETAAAAFAAALDGCEVAVSFIDGPQAEAVLADLLVDGCHRAGIGRLVHLGCLGSFGAVTEGRLDESVDPPRPPGADAARRWAFEQALLQAGVRVGVDVVVVTASLVYGPFTEAGARIPCDQVERGRVAPARSSGPCHLVFVDDVVEVLWAAATVVGVRPGRIFATGPAPIPWSTFFEAFEAIVGRPGVAVLADAELAALVHAPPEVQAEQRWPPRPSRPRRMAARIERRTLHRRADPPARRRLVLPDPDERASRAARVEVPIVRAATELRWAPVVGFDEGMRRTEAYLRWADPRWRS